MIRFQKTGYKPKSLVTDLVLGFFDGVDNALWCYGFAAILFSGVMAGFMPLMLMLMLLGWAVVGIFIAVTSKAPVHLINLDEQAIVIISTIGGLMVAEMGAEVAASSRGLSTMLAVVSLTSLTVALSFLLVGRFHLTRILELIPYPVICGFMSGIAWLMLQAGVGIAVDLPISVELLRALSEPGNILRLGIMIAGGFVLLFITNRSQHAWAMPLAALGIGLLFFLIAFSADYSKEQLQAENWLFQIQSDAGGALSILGLRSFFEIDVGFVISVLPQILTMAFLAMLTASMSLSAMVAGGNQEMVTAEEMQIAGTGNVFLGLIGAPSAYNDVTSSLLFKQFGASSRWTAIASSIVLLFVAVVGSGLISWMPKVLVGSVVFLFTFQMLYEWMYLAVRGFQPVDYAIVCIILGTVIFVGFMPGVFVGIMLALLLFVMRYSMISAVQGQYSLAAYRSSVERSPRAVKLLDEHGGVALVYTLRGFLFFGTANSILDLIRDHSGIREGKLKAILLDLKRVTGMDISALKTFMQIRALCDATGVKLMYAGVPRGTEQRIVMMNAVSREQGKPLFFKESDYAVEYIENLILASLGESDSTKTIESYLNELFPEPEKVRLLMSAMKRIEVKVGQTLFQQGDDDTGLFMLESGSMTALIGTATSGMKRVKKFNAGSVIGEMSSYTSDRKRTATIIANEPSVVYHLPSNTFDSLDASDSRLVSSIHELVARTLGTRITYMNRRLIQELR